MSIDEFKKALAKAKDVWVRVKFWKGTAARGMSSGYFSVSKAQVLSEIHSINWGKKVPQINARWDEDHWGLEIDYL